MLVCDAGGSGINRSSVEGEASHCAVSLSTSSSGSTISGSTAPSVTLSILETLASEDNGGLDDEVRSGNDDKEEQGTGPRSGSRGNSCCASGVASLLDDGIEASEGGGTEADGTESPVLVLSAVPGLEIDVARERARWYPDVGGRGGKITSLGNAGFT